MNVKQKAFVDEYMKDFNGTQACIRAGYSPKGARQTGSKLLAHTNINAEVERRKEALRRENSVTVEKIIKQLALIAFTPITSFMTWSGGAVDLKNSDDIPLELHSVIEQIEESANPTAHNIKLRFSNRMKAIELLGKHFGMFTDKIEITDDKLKEVLKRKLGKS